MSILWENTKLYKELAEFILHKKDGCNLEERVETSV